MQPPFCLECVACPLPSYGIIRQYDEMEGTDRKRKKDPGLAAHFLSQCLRAALVCRGKKLDDETTVTNFMIYI